MAVDKKIFRNLALGIPLLFGTGCPAAPPVPETPPPERITHDDGLSSNPLKWILEKLREADYNQENPLIRLQERSDEIREEASSSIYGMKVDQLLDIIYGFTEALSILTRRNGKEFGHTQMMETFDGLESYHESKIGEQSLRLVPVDRVAEGTRAFIGDVEQMIETFKSEIASGQNQSTSSERSR